MRERRDERFRGGFARGDQRHVRVRARWLAIDDENRATRFARDTLGCRADDAVPRTTSISAKDDQVGAPFARDARHDGVRLTDADGDRGSSLESSMLSHLPQQRGLRMISLSACNSYGRLSIDDVQQQQIRIKNATESQRSLHGVIRARP